MSFFGFLNPQRMTPFLKAIKSLSITFYLYLNINLRAEIWKVKRIEKATALSNSKKTIAFTKSYI